MVRVRTNQLLIIPVVRADTFQGLAAGILKEITGLQRGRVYAFHDYINLFEK